jgi:sugar O-acyltransferase (sialic acid O-acetyltransferase NeuD family)
VTGRALVIIGCGGFGREVYGIATAINEAGGDWDLAGFVDDAPSDANARLVADLGSRVLGPVSTVAQLAQARGSQPIHAVVAIGDPRIRAGIVGQLAPSGVDWPVLVHPDSTVGPRVTLGSGTVLAPGVRLSTGITVGRHVHIDQNVAIGHDTRIGDFARLNPQACVSGSVTLGCHVLVGANATILQGRTIGEGATIGAAACVTKDVGPGRTVKGVPAA